MIIARIRKLVFRSQSQRRILAELAFLVLLVAAAFLLRLWPISRGHFWDEAVYLQDAEVICCGKINYSELDSRPPLLSLLFAAMFLVWHSAIAANIATALLNALGPVFLYLGGRVFLRRAAAALASLLLACLPFFVGVFGDATGNTLLSDSPALTLILLSFWLLLRALHKQTDLRFASAGFVLGLAVLMRFPSLASVAVLLPLVHGASRWWRAALACGTGFAAAVGPYLCWSRLRYGGFLTTFRNGWSNFEGPGEPFLYYVNNFTRVFTWLTVTGLVLWILERLWKGRGRKRRPIATAVPSERGPSANLDAFLWFWAAAILLSFNSVHHKETRYILPLAPPLLLLAGSGLSVLLRGRGMMVRTAGIAMLAGSLLYTFLFSFARLRSPLINEENSEEMDVANFLNITVPPGTVLYANFNYPVFAYYTNFPVYRLPEEPSEIYDALNHLPTDGLLIAYKDNKFIQDPRLDWLDANRHFQRWRAFPSLLIYRYSPAQAEVVSANHGP